MNPAEALEILRATPRALRALLGGLSEPWVDVHPDPGVWSPKDVMGHFISGEKTDWVPRTRIMIEHGESKPFEPFDRDGWRAESAGLSMAELLDTFEDLRCANMATLEELDVTEHLHARGMHPAFGSVTLEQMLATWAVHDLGHLGQIVEVMAKRWRDEIGLWRRYLPIVDRPEEDSG